MVSPLKGGDGMRYPSNLRPEERQELDNLDAQRAEIAKARRRILERCRKRKPQPKEET